MNRLLLDSWKSRLITAEALLAAEDAVDERTIRKALTSTTAALKQALERLEAVSRDLDDVRTSSRTWKNRYESFLSSFPFGSIITSPTGEIAATNTEGGVLLNTSPSHLVGRSILLYLDDRPSWIAALRELRNTGATVRSAVVVRPRERARKPMLASIARIDDESLCWVFLGSDRLAVSRTTPPRQSANC